MLPITDTMKALGAQRPIFHSKADFQLAIASEIHRRLPGASLQLERPFSLKDNRSRLDVLVIQETGLLAIELKYKTRRFSLRYGDEQFTLKEHSAEDQGRYDFIKDIERLEQIVSSEQNATGYAILLTNDSLYWRQSRDAHPIDRDLRVHEGALLHGVLKWSTRAGKGSTKSRERPLELKHAYQMHWEDYSHPSSQSNGVFRFLAVKVESAGNLEDETAAHVQELKQLFATTQELPNARTISEEEIASEIDAYRAKQ